MRPHNAGIPLDASPSRSAPTPPLPCRCAPAAFKTILRSNAQVGNNAFRFGQVRTNTGAPVYEFDAAGAPTSKILVSNEPDFSSLHEVRWEGEGSRLLRDAQAGRAAQWAAPRAHHPASADPSAGPRPATPLSCASHLHAPLQMRGAMGKKKVFLVTQFEAPRPAAE